MEKVAQYIASQPPGLAKNAWRKAHLQIAANGPF
jgi:hypothetical protein